MRKLFFLYFIFVVFNSVSAFQFSPTGMEFILEEGTTSCKNVFVQLDSDAFVSDRWTYGENEWKISDFTLSSEEIGIETDYPSDLDLTKKEIKFCLTALQSGTYKGALIFTQSSEGNSRIQFAIWLDVKVKEKNIVPTGNSEEETSTGSSSRNKRQGGPLYGGSQNEFLNLKINESPEENEKILLGGLENRKELNNLNELIFLGIFIALFVVSLTFLFLIAVRRNNRKIKNKE